MHNPGNLILESGYGVYPAGEQACLKFRLTGELKHIPDSAVRFLYVRDDWRREDGTVTDVSEQEKSLWQPLQWTRAKNILSARIRLNGEHEHVIMACISLDSRVFRKQFHLYSVEKDLAGLIAFKGNVHCHSTGSDGLFSPEETAAVMRGSGFDFFALTDHDNYAPSAELCRALGALQSGFACWPGEEVSAHPGVNHILSLGCSRSVAEDLSGNSAAFRASVRRQAENPGFRELPPHEKELASQTEVIFQKIREFGGLSVFCHPYWFCEGRYYSTPEENNLLLQKGSYDALELGNYKIPRTALLNARLAELRAGGMTDRPLIGSSDWHGRPGQFANHDYTVIWARKADFPSFAQALKKRLCVASGGYRDEFFFGSFRLVKYAYFLKEYYFDPLHAPLCRKQGKLLRSALLDHADVTEQIHAVRIRIEELQRNFFHTC